MRRLVSLLLIRQSFSSHEAAPRSLTGWLWCWGMILPWFPGKMPAAKQSHICTLGLGAF